MNQQEYVIAVIGAGPRGTSFLERLLAQVQHSSPGQRRPLRVYVFDPAPHGPGRVWHPEQSPYYLMNTPASYPTAAPAGETQDELPASSCSLSFMDYCRANGLNADTAAYPARAAYGTYLAWLSKEASAHLRGRAVGVDHISSEVTQLTQLDSGYVLTTEGRDYRADAVILALGHLEAEQGSGPSHLAAQAERLGLHYQGPAVPTDVDYDRFRAGEKVLVRGMGLNFFDLMIQVTAARGGRFQLDSGAPPGRRLSYIASGQEPHLIAGSRRGTPYRAKTTAPGFVPEGIELRYLTEEAVRGLLETHGELDFAEHLWPLIQQDVTATYTQFGGAGEFDPQTFARPFTERHWDSPEEHQQTMVDWLEHDAAAAAAGAGSPEKMAVNALHAARLTVKRLITDRRIRPESRLRDVEGWFEALVEGLTSGPPLQRMEELAALARAGIVEFLGPEPVYGIDSTQRAFIADSAVVQGARYAAEHMIEAMMPPNRITEATSPLVRGLLQQGLALPAAVEAGGQSHVHKGFEVTEQPHRLVHRAGTAGQIYVLGLQLASAQWGTAIAAEAGGDPRTTARTLADAQAAAAAVLQQAAGED